MAVKLGLTGVGTLPQSHHTGIEIPQSRAGSSLLFCPQSHHTGIEIEVIALDF